MQKPRRAAGGQRRRQFFGRVLARRRATLREFSAVLLLFYTFQKWSFWRTHVWHMNNYCRNLMKGWVDLRISNKTLISFTKFKHTLNWNPDYNTHKKKYACVRVCVWGCVCEGLSFRRSSHMCSMWRTGPWHSKTRQWCCPQYAQSTTYGWFRWSWWHDRTSVTSHFPLPLHRPKSFRTEIHPENRMQQRCLAYQVLTWRLQKVGGNNHAILGSVSNWN